MEADDQARGEPAGVIGESEGLGAPCVGEIAAIDPVLEPRDRFTERPSTDL